MLDKFFPEGTASLAGGAKTANTMGVEPPCEGLSDARIVREANVAESARRRRRRSSLFDAIHFRFF